MNTSIATENIFNIKSPEEFEKLALDIFRFQAAECAIYSKFISSLGKNPADINRISQIPFLPIEFFKSHDILSVNSQPQVIFSSSGTTGMSQSKHLVTDVSIYESSFRKGFAELYGDMERYAILALLPSYQERGGSSLIYMVNDIIGQSSKPESGYFLYNHGELFDTLTDLQHKSVPTILIGVTYALLDFIESYPITFPNLIVMETGGMKGKRQELIRQELHDTLCKGFGVKTIHSEYGMTELLSQAYSTGNGLFKCPPWMQVLIRDINDPFTLLDNQQTGGINVIDLANINSCSFIATQDLGKVYDDEYFEVLGRFDNSDIRGCNLLVQ